MPTWQYKMILEQTFLNEFEHLKNIWTQIISFCKD